MSSTLSQSPTARGQQRWFFGMLAEVKASSADTGGRYTFVEMTAPAGLQVPLHVHHTEDEGFYVVEGSITIQLGDELIEVGAGEHAYGPHGIPELWERFSRWMAGRDLRMADTVRLGIAYDDPSVTAAEKLRYDACVVVPPQFTADRWVNLMDVPGGRFAVAPFVGSPRDITRAWDSVFSTWLPQSGFQPDDRPCFEMYRGNPFVDDKGTFRCDLYMPVRPL